jgi:uncharacterized BrkB/YihY/UPF0761 family membrane protein
MQKVKKSVKEKSLLFKVIKVFSDNRLSTVAGAWVFYFLTAVIPLVFLLITAFGVFGVELSKRKFFEQQKVNDFLNDFSILPISNSIRRFAKEKARLQKNIKRRTTI